MIAAALPRTISVRLAQRRDYCYKFKASFEGETSWETGPSDGHEYECWRLVWMLRQSQVAIVPTLQNNMEAQSETFGALFSRAMVKEHSLGTQKYEKVWV